ncbi:hypothetical protein, partial [Cohnella sp. CFH 77786]|uniref:hypothetical protein n=1 Tax=Cohnella sp. CFH 77786 TaxID=2662265 RepID=UPI001C61024B
MPARHVNTMLTEVLGFFELSEKVNFSSKHPSKYALLLLHRNTSASTPFTTTSSKNLSKYALYYYFIETPQQVRPLLLLHRNTPASTPFSTTSLKRPSKYALYYCIIETPQQIHTLKWFFREFQLTSLVFTNPRTLSPNGAAAARLGSQGCPPDSASTKFLGRTEGRRMPARHVNTMLTEVLGFFELSEKVNFSSKHPSKYALLLLHRNTPASTLYYYFIETPQQVRPLLLLHRKTSASTPFTTTSSKHPSKYALYYYFIETPQQVRPLVLHH